MDHYLLDKNWEYVESGLKNPLLVNMLNGWKKTDLPHDYAMEKERSPEAPGGLDEGFTKGAGLYYKKSFLLSREACNKRVWLEFEGVSGMTQVWVNQKFAAKHVNPYTSFCVEITEQLKEGENTISLHTDSRMKPCSRWYVGAGLYRPVWLHIAEGTAVSPHGLRVTTKELQGRTALLKVEAEITTLQTETKTEVQVHPGKSTRTATADVSILSSKGKVTGEASCAVTMQNGRGRAEMEIPVSNITPWSVVNPCLYTIKMTVNGLDTYEEAFGIRTIQVDPVHGFQLNGTPMKLKGGCIHHDLGILGAAEHEAAQYRRIRRLKESGFNALRLSHNPFGPTIFNVCDRLGMLVIEEAFDEWVLGRTSFGSHIFFEEHWEKDMEDMITRDYNHPSIIMWSTGNEVEERDGSADGFAWSRRLAEKVKSLDFSRPVSATACSLFIEYTQQRPKDEEGTTGNQALNMAYDNFASGVDLWGDATAEYFAPLDVAGYNYKAARYAHDREKFPDRVIYGSESYPRAAFSSWQETIKNPNVIGDFVWTAWDYLGEAGIGRWEISEDDRPGSPAWPWIAAGCADFDLIGEKRPQSYYRDALWENDHAPHLFTLSPDLTGKHLARLSWAWLPVASTYTYPGAEGQPMEAHIYANAQEVELFQNGQSLGRKACGVEEEYQTVFSLSYEPGTLEAVSYIAGKETGREYLVTAKETCTLSLIPERTSIKADGRDLCFIKIQAVDESGIPVFLEDREITVEVQGGKLLALGTADVKPDRLIPYQGCSVPLYEGKALAVIQSVEGGQGCLCSVRMGEQIQNSITIAYTQVECSDTSLVSEPKSDALVLPIGELLEAESTKEILGQLLPGILDNPMLEHMKGMTLKKMASMGGVQYDPALIDKLNTARGM